MLAAQMEPGRQTFDPAGAGALLITGTAAGIGAGALIGWAAGSLSYGLLVVLETLAPPERLAFVLHDMFDLSFDEIAPIVDRSPTAARQLASRARRRVPDLTSQRQIVDAFLAAARGGNFEALLAVLDPDAVLRSDPAAA